MIPVESNIVLNRKDVLLRTMSFYVYMNRQVAKDAKVSFGFPDRDGRSGKITNALRAKLKLNPNSAISLPTENIEFFYF